MREEIFGPVLPVDTFDSFDECLARLEARGRPAGGVRLQPRPGQAGPLRQAPSDAGGVCVNDTVVPPVRQAPPRSAASAPSGMGRYHGKASFDTFSNHKAVVRGTGRVDLPWRYPPGAHARSRDSNACSAGSCAATRTRAWRAAVPRPPKPVLAREFFYAAPAPRALNIKEKLSFSCGVPNTTLM
jgi:hypothetical protein